MASVIRELHMTQLPFPMASQLTGLDADLLRKLVRDGVIDGVAPVRSEAGTCDIDQARNVATRLDAARQPVEGHAILATEAETKYGFSTSSIYRWHKLGWVKIAHIKDGNRYFNEGDLAFAFALAQMLNYKQGKALFPTPKPSGRPPKG